MFTATIEHILSSRKLLEAAQSIESRAVGIDKESLQSYIDSPDKIELLSSELVGGSYTPMPMERIEIPKSDGEKRALGISSVRDKIVQKALAMALSDYFDPLFSDRSYGYRTGKGALRAINRCRDILRRGYRVVYRSDIDDFFETIEHERLIERLSQHISDERIAKLISIFLENGVFDSFDYLEHKEGVHQGDPLSPLLSNIYLDEMDRWLERHNIEFVRFADDFTLFFKHNETLDGAVDTLQKWIVEELGLKLEEKKSYKAHVDREGFTFLGVRFHENHLLIDNERLQKKISKLYALNKKSWSLEHYISEVSQFVEGLERYYLKIIDSKSPQFAHLEHALIDSVSRRVARAFRDGEIRFKKEARPIVSPLKPLTPMSASDIDSFVSDIVDRAKNIAKSVDRDSEESKRALGKKREKIARKMASSSVIVADGYGIRIGVSKGRISLKKSGKVIQSIPKKECRRIIVQNRSISLSGALIYECSQRDIAIDFIDSESKPYATLYSYSSAYSKRYEKQLECSLEPECALVLAKKFVHAKIKNQRNYLKYLDKHHNDASYHIGKIKAIEKKIATAGDKEMLMGLEGSASALYWDALSIISKEHIDFGGRVTRGAKDPVNSALNYGYAILYTEVTRALVDAGLSLHISFLHSGDGKKPTLVFDMVEEFRTFVVDRSIFSMFNRDEPIEVDDDGKLTVESRRLISKNIIERLGSYTKYRKNRVRLDNVIATQAYRLASHIEEAKRYNAFVGRY